MENGHTTPYLVAIAGTKTPQKSRKGQKRLITNIVLYDKDYYVNNHNSHDIALLKTNKPFKMNDNVKLVKWGHTVDYNEKATIYGWGKTLTEEVASYLQKKDLNLIPRDKCRKMAKKNAKVELREHEICTEKSPCFGDSGGPLVQTVNGEPTLIGIASWAVDNCTVPPTVFVFPGHFDAWLSSEMKRLQQK